MAKYANIRSSLKTGDLVLFSGKSFSSESIKWVTLSKWSHVTMVMVMPEYDFVCLWEATTDANLRDLDAPCAHQGVQLVPLSERMRQYDGAIALRRLEDVQLVQSDIDRLMVLRKKLARRPYEKSTLELMAAAYDGPFGNQHQNLSSLFCSELIAAAYQALELLPKGRSSKPSNEYVPADFSEEHEELPWLRGRLGPEIRLTL